MTQPTKRVSYRTGGGRRETEQRRHVFAPPPAEQHDVPWRDFQQTTRFAAVAGIAAAAVYLSFIYDPIHRNSPVLWVLTVLAESIVVLHSLGIWATLVSYRSDIPEREELAVIRRALLTGEVETPTIDVFVCAAGEPLHVVIQTALAADEMVLPHRTWILDDGRDPDVRTAAERIGVGYLRRDTNRHAKAGNVNEAMRRTQGRFVVVFDADHVPRPDFLIKTIPHLMTNPSIAMVQTPQNYDTDGRGMVSEGAAVSQRLFYEAIMPAKNASNSAFCVGTNVVYRRSALEALTTREPTRIEMRRAERQGVVAERPKTQLGEEYPSGGIWIGSNSEDIWTSLELHRRGWRTVFLPKVLSRGLTPNRISSYLTQQARWAAGGWEIALWAKILREPRLTLSQKLQYLLVPSHYALSLATSVFVFMSPIYLLMDRSPIRAEFWDWFFHYVPFYAFTVAIPFLQAGRIRVSAILVSLAAAPAHVGALVATALGQKASWNVTNSRRAGGVVRPLLPHLVFGCFAAMSLCVGWTLHAPDARSRVIASFFVATHLLGVIALVIGSVRADRLARKAEQLEPTPEEALDLLDDYLDLGRLELDRHALTTS